VDTGLWQHSVGPFARPNPLHGKNWYYMQDNTWSDFCSQLRHNHPWQHWPCHLRICDSTSHC